MIFNQVTLTLTGQFADIAEPVSDAYPPKTAVVLTEGRSTVGGSLRGQCGFQKQWPALSYVLWLRVCLAVPLNLPSVVRHSIPPKTAVPGPGVLRETMLREAGPVLGSAPFPLSQPSHCAGPAASTSVVRTKLDAVFYPAEQQMTGKGVQAVLNSAPEPCHVWLTSVLGWPCKCSIPSSAWTFSLL